MKVSMTNAEGPVVAGTAVECDWPQRNGGAHTREQETDKVISIEARKLLERNGVVFLSSIEGPSESRRSDIIKDGVVRVACG